MDGGGKGPVKERGLTNIKGSDVINKCKNTGFWTQENSLRFNIYVWLTDCQVRKRVLNFKLDFQLLAERERELWGRSNSLHKYTRTGLQKYRGVVGVPDSIGAKILTPALAATGFTIQPFNSFSPLEL